MSIIQKLFFGTGLILFIVDDDDDDDDDDYKDHLASLSSPGRLS